MVFRNTLFRRQVAKHRALVLIVSAHTTKTFGNVLMSRGNLLFQQRLKAAAGMIGRPAKRHSRKQVRSSQQASTRVDAARTSACATSEMRSSQRSKKLSCCNTEQHSRNQTNEEKTSMRRRGDWFVRGVNYGGQEEC